MLTKVIMADHYMINHIKEFSKLDFKVMIVTGKALAKKNGVQDDVVAALT